MVDSDGMHEKKNPFGPVNRTGRMCERLVRTGFLDFACVALGGWFFWMNVVSRPIWFGFMVEPSRENGWWAPGLRGTG